MDDAAPPTNQLPIAFSLHRSGRRGRPSPGAPGTRTVSVSGRKQPAAACVRRLLDLLLLHRGRRVVRRSCRCVPGQRTFHRGQGGPGGASGGGCLPDRAAPGDGVDHRIPSNRFPDPAGRAVRFAAPGARRFRRRISLRPPGGGPAVGRRPGRSRAQGKCNS